jgi:hypothetical protein
MIELYHGTLAINVPSIRKLGLLPQKGNWTSKFRPSASELVYAVDYEHIGRLVVYISGQMAKSNLVQISGNYEFDHFTNDLIQYAALVMIRTQRFSQYPTHLTEAHPSGPEPGDWYSYEPVLVDEIQRIVTGQEMLHWLRPTEADFTERLRYVLRGK